MINKDEISRDAGEQSSEFTRYGNVIMSWKRNTSDSFAGMLRYFIPAPATVIDLCAGDRRMYRRLLSGTLGENYRFIFGDIRELPGLHYVCNILNPPAELIGQADGYIFDPPWPSTSGSLGSLVDKYCPMKPAEFREFLPKALLQVDRILRPGGILIVKAGTPWTHHIYSLLQEGYKWRRDIVQVSVNHNIYLISYFMIFEKKKIKESKETKRQEVIK
jgi:hypothetical protein